jgi:DNA sulfur modification protein DndB
MNENSPATFPAIRAWMGDWVYYVTTMTFWDIKQRVVREVTEIHNNKGLSDMIQRVLESRSKEITRYLQTENQRFFSSIIAGVYQGEPQWNSIRITQERDRLPLDKRTIESVGILELSGKERIFAVDGQHRVAAIKDLITDEEHVNAGEEICVIFVAHSENHRERTRRLFTTLNKHARAVKAGEKVALDEDDAFAITTRKLVEDYEPLSKERVFYGKTPPIPKNNRKAVTTILTLFKITEIIMTPTKKTRTISQELKMMKNFRPSDEVLEKIYLEQCEFWDALRKYVPSMKEATDAEAEKEIVAKYRTDDGGNLLFRPAGQIAFASAT